MSRDEILSMLEEAARTQFLLYKEACRRDGVGVSDDGPEKLFRAGFSSGLAFHKDFIEYLRNE